MSPLPEVPSAAPGGERAGAALVEHYARLVRLGYLVLPPTPGSHRRVLTAHALAQRCLLPCRRAAREDGPPRAAPAAGPSYARARLRVLRAALEAGRERRRSFRARLPSPLPLVWGLRLLPHSGGTEGLALENALAALSGPGRAAHALRGLEGLADAEARRVLAAAGVADPHAALAEAEAVSAPYALLGSPEFDPCSLQARPPDLLRRRQYAKAALAAGAALLVCGALLGPAGHRPGRGGAPDPREAAASAALDPGRLGRVDAASWRRSARTDFTAWPARGDRAGDAGLLRRALGAWARPGGAVRVSVTSDTPAGPPMGAPQLLYAGGVGRAAVVLLYDGLRVVRYAEPRDAGRTAGAALDFARVDGADRASASALVVARSGERVRYLTAPWVSAVSVRDLLAPDGAPRPLGRRADGVTDAVAGPATASGCRSWPAVELRDGAAARLLTDLGELVPARLTSGPPSAPHDVAGRTERDGWARTACLLPSVRSAGVRSVNSWRFAEQPLPEGDGVARWFCTRAETWRGAGSRVLAQFQAPSAPAVATGGPPGAVAARAEDSPACGVRDPRVLAGVLWRSRGGRWYVLAAGSEQVASLAASGGVEGRSGGRLLAVRARAGDRARLNGTLADGSRVGGLR
ncbi:hypothetical protein ACFVWY_25590 [Streptomyces sp. NPDC058195]|uniref:hypothetical protein n=1 Tax=Streptomyces sp. NPDC058195 TaxID=3346375 RepID=UPI0036EC7597